jgi:catechol 2,3-dioxygenase-like lactoylglutathione lyase family enzyme
LVDDLPACLKFYRDVLGFKVKYGDGKAPYVEFRLDGIVLALFKRGLMCDAIGQKNVPARKKGLDQVVLGIKVADVDKAYGSLRSKGVKFVTAPTDRPDWRIRVAHFRDPDGNLLEINALRK